MYSLPKAGGLRRRLAILNPIHFFNLSEFICNQWTNLHNVFATSQLSLSTPITDPSGNRALRTAYLVGDLLLPRALGRAQGKYILRADLAEFYPSFYTHSLPWALHGKAVAKANQKSMAYYGNKFDLLIRRGQDHQTVGIPIGPDTSLVAAEAVLSVVDAALCARIPNLNGIRYMDEYELVFRDIGEAESALASLQAILTDFELRLNPRKTKIDPSPVEFDRPWLHELRNFKFARGAIKQQLELGHYFDIITRYTLSNPADHVVKYGLARIKNEQINPLNWQLYQALLSSTVIAQPYAVDHYVNCLVTSTLAGHIIQNDLVGMTLNSILQQSIPLGHTHEASWALWGLLAFGLQVENASASAISESEQSPIVLLALDAESRGLIPAGLNKNKWLPKMCGSELYGEEWLLSFEANVKGWLPSTTQVDHVAADSNFGFLKTAGIEFYSSPSSPPQAAPLTTHTGVYAIAPGA
jgi:hypothetical protein